MVLFNFDLDDFKPKNDRYGHIVGDLILKAVGISLFEILRSTDVGSHFSGDEYGGILIVELPPNTKQTDESSAIKKIVSEVVDRVQKKTPETLEKLIKKAKEEAEEGTFPEDLTADTVFADGEQQVSTGYVIVRHDSHGAYSDFSQKADEGQKCSKMLKNLSIKTGHRLPGPGRVVDFAETKEIGERFSKKERAYMDAVGGCNRPIDELIATGLVLPNTNIKEKIAELIRTALEEGEK